jgi:phage shock protein A
MRRYLKLTDELSPLRQWRDRKTVDRLLYQTKRSLDEFYLHYREQAVQVITQRDYQQTQVDDLQKGMISLQAEINEAIRDNQQGLADKLLKEQQDRNEQLRSAENAFQQAKDITEQLKMTIEREKEELLKAMVDRIAAQTKWKADAISKEMQRQLESLSVYA